MKTEQFHVKNQFVLTDDDGSRFFQSYDSIICKIDISGKTFLDSYYWNYSKTTGKYRNLFLNEDRKTTEKRFSLVNIL